MKDKIIFFAGLLAFAAICGVGTAFLSHLDQGPIKITNGDQITDFQLKEYAPNAPQI